MSLQQGSFTLIASQGSCWPYVERSISWDQQVHQSRGRPSGGVSTGIQVVPLVAPVCLSISWQWMHGELR